MLNSAPLLILILLADFAITLLHSYQEWKGAGAPLWRNFGAIVGLYIPDQWGFPLFTVGLTLALFAIGFVGIIGPLNASWPRGCAGRLDRRAIVRHARLSRLAPWAGISSQSRTFLYAALCS